MIVNIGERTLNNLVFFSKIMGGYLCVVNNEFRYYKWANVDSYNKVTSASNNPIKLGRISKDIIQSFRERTGSWKEVDISSLTFSKEAFNSLYELDKLRT